jgi:transporter family protein
MNTDHRLLLYSGLTILMWGLWGFFGKLALERKMAPTSIFLVETLVSAALAIPLFLILVHGQGAQSPAASFNAFGLLSGVALALGLFFYYLALQQGRVSIVVPLTATYPVVAALLGVGLLGERPSLTQWLGVLLVVTGAALLLSGPLAEAPRE